MAGRLLLAVTVSKLSFAVHTPSWFCEAGPGRARGDRWGCCHPPAPGEEPAGPLPGVHGFHHQRVRLEQPHCVPELWVAIWFLAAAFLCPGSRYEGTGRSLSLKLIQQLRQQSAQSQVTLTAENKATATAKLTSGTAPLDCVSPCLGTSQGCPTYPRALQLRERAYVGKWWNSTGFPPQVSDFKRWQVTVF